MKIPLDASKLGEIGLSNDGYSLIGGMEKLVHCENVMFVNSK